MPENWKTYKFEDLYDTSSGLSKARDQFGFGSPFVTFKDVFYNYFLPDVLGDLANTTHAEQLRGSIKRGDILLTRTSETLHELGMSSVALKDYPNATFNGFCKRLRLKDNCTVKVHPLFIGYYLRSSTFRSEVSAHATMTTRASLNNTSISSLHVTLPNFNEQEAIGEILKSLDDKIQLNLQQNKTLEEMAMTLYKHWFVDFGPFQDGAFVDSELGMIPEGWEVNKLGEILDIINGYAFKGSDFIESGIPVLKIKNVKPNKIIFENLSYVPQEAVFKAEKARINFRDILITMTGNRMAGSMDSWVGKVAMFPRFGNYYLNQRVSKLIFNDKNEFYKDYLAIMLSSEEFQHFFIKNSTSSGGQANISPILVKSISFVNPPKEILIKFKRIVESFFELRSSIDIENQILIEKRNLLLPKLISGEIRVKDVEKQISELI